MKAKLSLLENLQYIWVNIITLGLAWTIKIIIKKAIIEANDR